MNADGTGKTQLTTTDAPVDNDFPSWSPDGSKIAFVSDKDETGNKDIYVVKVSDKTVTRVTNNAAEDNYPSWSPDGQWIVFASRRAGNSRIHKITATSASESTAPVILGDYATAGNDYYPTWSSNGKIAFTSSRATATTTNAYQLFVMDADGTNPTALTDNASAAINCDYPSWSPSGTKIVYRTNDNNIYKLDYTSGSTTVSNITPLTTTGKEDHPSWSPDGSKITTTSLVGLKADIYWFNADGTGIATNLTNDPLHKQTNPSWWR